MKTHEDGHGAWTGQLSDYMEGELDERTHATVEEHLVECGRCRRVLEELRAVVAAAASLGELQPPRDLWGGVAATISAPVPAGGHETKIIALPTLAGAAEAGSSRRARDTGSVRRSFSVPQLIAASVVLIASSATATWMVGPGVGARPSETAAPGAGGAVSMVSESDAVEIPDGLAEELAVLESALTEAREVLDPHTLRVLQRNLDVIEQAIVDSQHALALDPGNEFLAGHLERVVQRKLTYLRDVTRVAEWTS